MKKLTKGNIFTLVAFAVILVGVAIGNYECYIHSTEITTHLIGTGVVIDSEKAQNALLDGDELVEKIAAEGIVMLKNDNVLPLSVDKDKGYNVNLFGVGSTDDGFAYTGVGGSGVATIISEDILNSDGTIKYKHNRVTLKEGLEQAGFKVNTTLLDKYKDGNPDPSFYSTDDSVLKSAKEYSDTAIITITRQTGENYKTSELVGDVDNGLQITSKEQAIIDYVCDNYDKVIILINSTNTMEMGYLQNPKIKACLNVGVPGQSGTRAIGKILSGDVNPSGKLVDTIPYDTTQDPTWANAIREGGGNGKNQIFYAEDIYIGYKWYETADKEGYFNSVQNDYGEGYDGVVQYPFGYGLSYTDFEWTLKSAGFEVDGIKTELSKSNILTDKKAVINLEVEVKNTGTVAGKDVVQVYVNAPYYKGEIEKPYIRLVNFGKTSILEPNQTETLSISFDIYDFASYDCYDANNNGISGWELDPGDYCLKLMTDAHHQSNVEDITFVVPSAESDTGRKGFLYRFDNDSKGYIKNRFTGESAEAGVPIDGSSFDQDPVVYLSRNDFSSTFPKTKTKNRTESIVADTFINYYYKGYDDQSDLVAPILNRNSEEMLYLYTLEDGSKASLNDLEGTGKTVVPNEELILELGENYKSEKWNELLSQMSITDINNFISSAGFGTKPIESIGKPNLLDYDGSCGFNHKMANTYVSNAWTGYAGEFVLAQTYNVDLALQVGRVMGAEAKVTGGMTGIYAPCVNLHRTPYNTRNYEAYSEDGLLSGYIAANVIYGAKTNGLSCYIKHFALSEPGWNPNDLATWLTEQNLRENYLKPFEIAVKKAEVNAVMSAFNCVGAVRCCNSYSLLTEILRKEWGFKGSVITDYNMGEISQHVRAGNDLHLNPNTTVMNWINEKSVGDVYSGYLAVKNSLFTYCNTYYTAKTYDPSASLGVSKRVEQFVWWIPVLIFADLLVVGSIAFWLFRMFKTPKTTTDINIIATGDTKKKNRKNDKRIQDLIEELKLLNKELDDLEKLKKQRESKDDSNEE